MPSKPLRNALVEDDPDYLLIHPDGKVTRDARVSVTRDEFMQMAQGYMCARCYEPLKKSYPEICPMKGCGFEIKKYQDQYLEEHFQGEEWLGPSKGTLAHLDNKIDELNERGKAWERTQQ